MNNYVVAVSGGVDSVVLLDMLARTQTGNVTVAHFDHGIRPGSANDALFVERLAARYRLPFVTRREELGADASEELARNRRYAFLRQEAKRCSGVIVTAHHADDVVETIAINLSRGTGWRGLAVLNSPDIARPLLRFTKNELRRYATENCLEWVEDSTNNSTKYLRNRVRQTLTVLTDEQKQSVRALYQKQLLLSRAVDNEVTALLTDQKGEYSRYFFTQIDDVSACELLRGAIFEQTTIRLQRPQIERGLIAIKTARSTSRCDVGGGVKFLFTERTFIVETP